MTVGINLNVFHFTLAAAREVVKKPICVYSQTPFNDTIDKFAISKEKFWYTNF